MLVCFQYMAIIGTTAYLHRLPPPAASVAAAPVIAPQELAPEKQQETALAAAPAEFNVLPS